MTSASMNIVLSNEEAGIVRVTASVRMSCGSCSKSGGLQQALEGHVRRGHVNKRPENRTRTLAVAGDELEKKPMIICRVCGKSFGSRKSLNGHMRVHPERKYRGIKDPNEKKNSYHSSSSSSALDEPDLMKSSLPSNWSITGKRGRKSVSSGTATATTRKEGEVNIVEEKEDRKAAENLVWLSRSNPYSTHGHTQQFLSPEIDSTHDDQLSMALPIINQEQTTKSEMKGKRKLMEPDATRHQCKICTKCFPTGQALGGHMSAHIPKKPSNSSNQSSSVGETTPSQTGQKVFSFDLNELPPIDEDEVAVANDAASACSYNSHS